MFGFEIEFLISLLFLGAFVGIMAGLLGIGGGGIMVPVLTSLFLQQGISKDVVVHLALGTSMAAIVITSFSSFRAHHLKQAVLWHVVKKMTPGIILGAFLATFIVSYLSSLFLSIFFSLFMAYVALQMFLDIKPKPQRRLVGAQGLFLAGTGIGSISSLVSIGGGSLTVPFLVWQNIELKKAIGTSATIGFPISIAGTLGYIINGWSQSSFETYTFGYVFFPAVLLISLVSFFTAPYGVKLAHKLPVKRLKKIFALLLVFLSAKMLMFIVL